MRKIVININDKDYELMLNRNGIKWLEANGYVYEKSSTMPITSYDLLWTVGFLANYPSMTSEEVTSFMVNEYLAFINALADTKSLKKKAKITEM